jgi:macrodomain Ter protein organizer (MatP/YcbG family)
MKKLLKLLTTVNLDIEVWEYLRYLKFRRNTTIRQTINTLLRREAAKDREWQLSNDFKTIKDENKRTAQVI